MLKHGNSVAKESQVWVMIEGQPTLVIYTGLQPYKGFTYRLPGDDPKDERDSQDEALFADSKKNLAAGHMEILDEKIAVLKDEKDRIAHFLI